MQEARSDLEEAGERETGDAETGAALVVAAGLGAGKKGEAEELWTYVHSVYRSYLLLMRVEIYRKFINEHPSHPLVTDVAQKAGLFDEAAQNFEVPPLAVAAA